MNITIKYISDTWEELMESELPQLHKYSKKFYHDGIHKKTEYYEAGLHKVTSYVINESEVEATLISDPNAWLSIQKNINGYLVVASCVYENGSLVTKRVMVLDSQENLIYMSDYDVLTDSPIYTRTEKTIYNSAGESHYQFEYYNDGECIYIHNLREVQEDIFPEDVDVDPDVEFSWIGNEYYKFAYPVIPE